MSCLEWQMTDQQEGNLWLLIIFCETRTKLHNLMRGEESKLIQEAASVIEVRKLSRLLARILLN